MILRSDETADLSTPTGPMRTHVFRPVAAGRYPGIVLYSEIFQVTPPIRRTAAFLAGHGYVVAVPEIWHEFEPAGSSLAYDQAGADRGNALKLLKEVPAIDGDARATVDFLKSHPACTGRIGALGICVGGHLSYRASIVCPEIRATACFYATDLHKGSLGKGGDDTLRRTSELKSELLLIWGRQDPHVPRDGRRKIYEAVGDSGVEFTWHEFNGQHAFLRDEGHRHDPALTLLCQQLVLELFHRRLGEGDGAVAAGSAESRH